MNKRANWLTASVLCLYFLFTAGIPYEIVQRQNVEKIDIPYSIALSADRTGAMGVYEEDDMKCAAWIRKHWKPEVGVVADYNGARLLGGFIPIYLQYPLGTFENPTEGSYIFLSTWNVKTGDYILGLNAGQRIRRNLPEFDYPVVFQSGEAVIYRVP